MKRKKLTPKQRVLRRFPRAFCESYGQNGCQVVNLGKYAVARQLGQGRDPRNAWYDAAWNLRRNDGEAK